MKKVFLITASMVAMLFFELPFAHAATLRLVASGAAVVGQPYQVDIILDTQGDDANAVQATVDYPKNLFSLQTVNDGDSIINFWITPPAATSSGEVQFAGIVPDGFTGSSGAITSLIFNPIAAGTGSIGVSTATVLRNDGQGSPIPVTAPDITVSVAPSTNGEPNNTPAHSTIAPNPFTPEIAQETSTFNGQYFLVFQATDKGTGIDHYEVREGSGPWQVTQSPYLLKDQSLSSDIYVRAVDHAGNITVAEVPARYPHAIPWLTIVLVAIAAVLACVLVFLIWFAKRKKARS